MQGHGVGQMRVLGIETSCDETAAAVYDGRARAAVASPVQPGAAACRLWRGRAGAGLPRPRPQAAAADPGSARGGRDSAPSRSTASPIPPGPGWSGRCWSARRWPAVWPSPGTGPALGVHHLEGHLLAPDAGSGRRPSFRSWRCWSPAGTRCWPRSAAWATTRSSASSARRCRRRGLRQDRQAARACRIRAGRRWRSWPSRGGPGDSDFPRPDARPAGPRFQLQRAEDRGGRRDARPDARRADARRRRLRVPAGRGRNAGREVRARARADRIDDAGGRRRRRRESALRSELAALGERVGVRVLYPRPEFCTDNAAMIAYAGYRRLGGGEHDDLRSARPRAGRSTRCARRCSRSRSSIGRKHSRNGQDFPQRAHASNASSASGSGSGGSSRPSSSTWRWRPTFAAPQPAISIEDTIDYKKVAKRLLAFVGDSQFQLVETLAERIAQVVVVGVRRDLGQGAAQQAGRDSRRARCRHRDRAARRGLRGRVRSRRMTDVYVAAGSNVEPREISCARAATRSKRRFGALDVSPAYRNRGGGFRGRGLHQSGRRVSHRRCRAAAGARAAAGDRSACGRPRERRSGRRARWISTSCCTASWSATSPD